MNYFDRDLIQSQIELEKDKLSKYEEKLSSLYDEARQTTILIDVCRKNIEELEEKLGGENDWETDSELHHNFQY